MLERNPGRPDNHQIWQVGRATSAAPFYFKTVRLEEEDPKSEYIDGMSHSQLAISYRLFPGCGDAEPLIPRRFRGKQSYRRSLQVSEAIKQQQSASGTSPS